MILKYNVNWLILGRKRQPRSSLTFLLLANIFENRHLVLLFIRVCCANGFLFFISFLLYHSLCFFFTLNLYSHNVYSPQDVV